MRGNGNDGAQTKRKAANSTSKVIDEGNEKAPVKRQRVSRACDQCRAAREKCDGIQPVCFTCASSNRDCSYTTNPKKRGIQPGYIRTLELALAWVFSNVAGSEAALSTMLTADNGHGSSLLVGKDTVDSDKLHKRWRRSTVCKEVERLLSGSDNIDNDRLSPETPEPESGVFNVPQTQAGATKISTPQSPIHPRNQSSRPDAIMPILSHPSSSLGPAKSKLVLPANIWHLFDIYFAYTHSWLPISEKHDLLKLSYSYPEDGLEISPTSPGSGEHAELWSVLTLASIQEASTLNDSASQTASSRRSSEELYNTTRILIPNEDGTFELGHVKALILLSLVNLGQDKVEIAWLQIGHASRLLLCLEGRTGSPKAQASLNSRLKHVFAACFVLDTIISAQLGQPSYLAGSDIARRGPVDEEGLEEWHPWVGCEGFGVKKEAFAPSTRSPMHSLSVFNQLVKLISIFNASRHAENISRSSSLEAASQMESWIAGLPRTCAFVRTGTVSATSTPPILLLRLTYLFAVSVNDSSFVRPTGDLVNLLEYFSETVGVVALPSLVTSFLAILINHQGFGVLNTNFKSRIHNLKTACIKAWSPSSSDEHIRSDALPRENSNQANRGIATSQSSNTTNFQLPTPESIHATFQPAGPSFAAPQHHLSNVDSSQFHHVYQEIGIESYNPAAAMDLDAFFDELASLDGAENRENQPQFMQNLGFAPDADLTDVLASDYGQFDPLLSAFMNPSVLGHSSIDQGGPFDGG
ncbi:hypothetical protein BU16DRAFT_453213 [Lophium mytilinum]|uniref:Zn(2)-C6 fungal-type domain-containing protein n=1 Tax=Lophium mytilinum TaxID=390894 RepID=A0A6A6R5B4_9PEZI|nr:hypothetical protein BU16DRAFT_453213 [Lophium mytilinum]